MSKIGNLVIELQERKAAVKYLNPYNKYSDRDNAARQYYVDYTRYRDKHQARHDLVRSY